MSCPDAAAAALGEGALGKHEELGPLGCTCGPEHLRLRSDQGELVKPRGGCVNKCDYCAKLAAVENCEMLVLDALDGNAPTIIAILGTRTATLDMGAFKLARRKLVELVRRRWPAFQYAYEVEFTTGYGPRSGGLRRPHWNWFVKGVPTDDLDAFRELVLEVWCRYVDAEPHVQYVDQIRNEVGLTKYVTEHFMKASQRPPDGFTGQRFCASRSYFGEHTTVATARARARESLMSKRELWKALQAGFDAHDAELVAREALELAYRTVWVLANDRGARVGPVADRPELRAVARLRGELEYRRVARAFDLVADARELVLEGERSSRPVETGVFDLQAGVTTPPRRAVTASEGLRRSPEGEP